MNRIILIGNGFDLAHGLETSYSHFIDDFWEDKIKEVQKTQIKSKYEDEYISINKVPINWIPGYKYEDFLQSLEYTISKINFNNKFLEIINAQKVGQNWVDIENEYYRLLKINLNDKYNGYNISDLNYDFNLIKNALEEYLKRIEDDYKKKRNNNILTKTIGRKIYSNFKLKDFTENSINEITEHEFKKIKEIIDNKKRKLELSSTEEDLYNKFKYYDTFKEYRSLLLSEDAENYFKFQPEQTLFLSFNYTNTEVLYINPAEFNINDRIQKVIHIHGTINKDDKNPIIFGFGDEIDDDYKAIENLNDNEYLENIKSIKYLETDNYKQLLEFINADDYQIFIFGHSCGISDRTLLNTLFEHENCVSIKPFYHKKSSTEDNYSDIVRNISRNFNNKSVMRDKVVNKNFCEPLIDL